MANFKFPDPSTIDRNYVAFRDGFLNLLVDKPGTGPLRWIPWTNPGGWAVYRLEQCDLLDFGVSGPESPLQSALFQRGQQWVTVWKWKDVSYGILSGINIELADTGRAQRTFTLNTSHAQKRGLESI
jgi:hypothetical protein